ncbi:E3 ubiquitin-protein ligase RNF212B isoform X2 [Engystomops pustulosus]|uniref:E3 ubiquitin-protein ligase RNF212B isoform X2 n=1 Tax=Engystomops pustulosus TaxID=76066 RepID=UPI003AFB2D40
MENMKNNFCSGYNRGTSALTASSRLHGDGHHVPVPDTAQEEVWTGSIVMFATYVRTQITTSLAVDILFARIASRKAWSFQKQQHDLHVTFYKEYITKVQNAYQEAMQKIKNQENELTAVKRENAELRSMVSNLKSSLSKSQSSSSYSSKQLTAMCSDRQPFFICGVCILC